MSVMVKGGEEDICVYGRFFLEEEEGDGEMGERW